MILTPIPSEALPGTLDRFMACLPDRFSHAVFQRIRATSPERAAGTEAERHRLAALSVARAFGMAIHPKATRCRFNWDGVALYGATEAFVIHTLDRAGAERAVTLSPLEREADEAAASLLGIIWEAALGQPALASFLDQNWLEGLERSAPAHFTAVLATLRCTGALNLRLTPAASTAPKRGRGPHCLSRWPWPPPRH